MRYLSIIALALLLPVVAFAQSPKPGSLTHLLEAGLGRFETTGVTNDVGMIYAKSGTIVVAFYSMGYTGLTADADDRLGHVARLIVEYFDGAG